MNAAEMLSLEREHVIILGVEFQIFKDYQKTLNLSSVYWTRNIPDYSINIDIHSYLLIYNLWQFKTPNLLRTLSSQFSSPARPLCSSLRHSSCTLGPKSLILTLPDQKKYSHTFWCRKCSPIFFRSDSQDLRTEKRPAVTLLVRQPIRVITAGFTSVLEGRS